MASVSNAVTRYLRKQAEEIHEAIYFEPPQENLRLCVVIPAMAEFESIFQVLDSLGDSSHRLHEAEVIVVVNQPDNAPLEVTENNKKTLEILRSRARSELNLIILDRASNGRAFAASKSGVGQARRLGMDLALRRLATVGRADDGIIACLDADACVAPGYIDNILEFFERNPSAPAGVCRYEHPYPECEQQIRAIVAYELWLRYFELGLRLANSPYSYQTIGSCIVVHAQAYARADGMPRRKAGEDFYLLQKLTKLFGSGSIETIDKTCVYPSARISTRVPFGTGPAIKHCMDDGLMRYQGVEPAGAFSDLQQLFACIPEVFVQGNDAIDTIIRRYCSPTCIDYLDSIHSWNILEKLRDNYSDTESFERGFHTWFDALKTVQYTHFYKENHGPQWIFDALSSILTHSSQEFLLEDLPKVSRETQCIKSQQTWLSFMRNI